MSRRPLVNIAVVFALAFAAVGLARAEGVSDSTVTPPPAAPPAAPPATPPAAAPPAAPAEVKPATVLYEKAQLVVDGEAQANGSIGLTFAPDSGQAKSFSVNVLAKTKKNDVAKAIYTELTLAAGANYKVKLSGQKIQISKVNKKFANFSLTVDKIELPGVSVLVKKS